MEGQEQQAPLKNQTNVLSCFDQLGEHTIWKEAKCPYTLATFSVLPTQGYNLCDFLFALKQLADQVVDVGDFEFCIGRVELLIV